MFESWRKRPGTESGDTGEDGTVDSVRRAAILGSGAAMVAAVLPADADARVTFYPESIDLQTDVVKRSVLYSAVVNMGLINMAQRDIARFVRVAAEAGENGGFKLSISYTNKAGVTYLKQIPEFTGDASNSDTVMNHILENWEKVN